MTAFLAEYGLFLAKTVTWVAALLVAAAGLAALVRGGRQGAGRDHLEVRSLNERFERLAEVMNHALLDPAGRKAEHKRLRREHKAQARARKAGAQPPRPRVFALRFKGDLQASAAESLREEVSAILQVARRDDEVLVRLESAGGLVHAYGLAASQLQRVRERGLRLTVAIDKVAASGGYLMACVAHHILAAPFAIVGSIGVVAQLPNFNRLLKKHDIDFELHTAGEHKRTLTVFGENTEAGREKFRQELEETHALFKAFVGQNRKALDLERVATGEHWYGAQAVALKLVDEIKTSDDWLLERARDADLFELHYRHRRSLGERLTQGLVRLGVALRSGVEQAFARPA